MNWGRIAVVFCHDISLFPTVPWHCWLGDNNGIRPINCCSPSILFRSYLMSSYKKEQETRPAKENWYMSSFTTDRDDEQTQSPAPTQQYGNQSSCCDDPLHRVNPRRLPQCHTVQAVHSHLATMPSPATTAYQVMNNIGSMWKTWHIM